MPRHTTAGNVQVNLTLAPEAYALLQRLAPTRKDYGRLLGTLLQDYDRTQHRDEIRERLDRLEERVGELVTR